MSLTPPARNYFSRDWFAAMVADAASAPAAGDLTQLSTRAALQAWRRRAKTELRALLGPLPEAVPPDLELLDTTDCGTYRRDHIVFNTTRHMSVPAYLLIPHARVTSGRAGPAILAQHGHGAGKAEICGLTSPEHGGDEEGEPNRYAHELAELGYVVLAPDLRTFGERAEWNPESIYACDHTHMHATMLGTSLLALDLWDLARGLDVLAADPLVDARRIGMVGLSQGGTCTLFLAAWDRRIRAAIVSGYFNEWETCAPIPWNICGSQVLPGILGRMDHGHLGALIAPRPLLVQTGTRDDIFPVDAAIRQAERVRHVFALEERPERFEHLVFEGGHRWHSESAAPFLERWLGNPRRIRPAAAARP